MIGEFDYYNDILKLMLLKEKKKIFSLLLYFIMPKSVSGILTC